MLIVGALAVVHYPLLRRYVLREGVGTGLVDQRAALEVS
jgi:hypothetical protein